MKYLVGLLLLCCLAAAGHSAVASLLIVNARVIDGTGAPAALRSVRIRGSTIEALGNLKARKDEAVFDAGGLILAPGFIDTHSHHDRGLDEHPEATAVVSQGITTIVIGQDGSSADSLAAMFDKLRTHPVAINIASFVGHNTVRSAAMGDDFKRLATPAEIERMRALVETGMKDGALGLSTGLEYDPGHYSNTAEILELAKVASRYGGRYASHIRSEDHDLWQAVDELVEIGRVAHMPVLYSHMKLAMVGWWGQNAKLIEKLEAARRSGVDLSGDVYPYDFWHATLSVMFPKRDFSNRESAARALETVAPADGLRLSWYTPDQSLAGKTVAEIAAARNTDNVTTLIDLVLKAEAPGQSASVMGTSMRGDDIDALVLWPGANICSDGAMDSRHPRGTGTFTRVLRDYVRERKLLTWEAAIHKMTEEAASHVGITGRGVIRRGLAADLVLIDPVTVSDRSSIADPTALSVGIERVWVNGVVVFAQGSPTGARSGVPILHPPRAP
ncbi:MAG TPA: D-aminoacylase [Steroidobacteraceae bacterium]|nr:D-aminoacylase [Steroidobacteraceae bacterium]